MEPRKVLRLAAADLPKCENQAVKRLFDPKNPPSRQKKDSVVNGQWHLNQFTTNLNTANFKNSVAYCSKNIHLQVPASSTYIDKLSDDDFSELLNYFQEFNNRDTIICIYINGKSIMFPDRNEDGTSSARLAKSVGELSLMDPHEAKQLLEHFKNLPGKDDFALFINGIRFKEQPKLGELQASLSEDSTNQLLSYFDASATAFYNGEYDYRKYTISEHLFGLSIPTVLVDGLRMLGLQGKVLISDFGILQGGQREWHIDKQVDGSITLTQKSIGFIIQINDDEPPQDKEYFKYFCESVGIDPDRTKAAKSPQFIEKSGSWSFYEVPCIVTSQTLLTAKGFKQNSYTVDAPVLMDAIVGQQYIAEPAKKPVRSSTVSFWSFVGNLFVSLWNYLMDYCRFSKPALPIEPIKIEIELPSIAPFVAAPGMSTGAISKDAGIPPQSLMGSPTVPQETPAEQKPETPDGLPTADPEHLPPLPKSSLDNKLSAN